MQCDERHQACLKNGFPALFFAQISVKPEVVKEVEVTDSHQHHFSDTNHISDIGGMLEEWNIFPVLVDTVYIADPGDT